MGRQSPLLGLSCLVLLALVVGAFSCGMSTHNFIGRRALQYFDFTPYPGIRDMITKWNTAFQAGCAFPDWGYNSGYPDESEAAHWPPFQRRLSEYIREKYGSDPSKWNDDAQKLVVFFLGAVSHSVADITWHALNGNYEGFIDASAALDYHGTYSAAHSNADDGGEFVMARDFGDSAWLEPAWYTPLDDIVAVYQSLNYTHVNTFNLFRGSMILYAAAEAIEKGGSDIYPIFVNESPFLAEEYNDYFNGGVDDMALWTALCWPYTLQWILTGDISSNCRAEPVQDVMKTKTAPRCSHGSSHIHDHPEIELKPEDVSNVIYGTRDASTKQQERDAAAAAALASAPASASPVKDGPPVLEAALTITSSIPYGQLGRAFTVGDFNADGVQDLAISQHGYGSQAGHAQSGAVYVIYGGPGFPISATSPLIPTDISSVANVTLLNPNNNSYARFGWSMTTLDFNLDGIEDIVVSAPSEDGADLRYRGRVYVYFGGKSFGASKPDITIETEIDYTNMGSALFSGDINLDGYPDLMIGCPHSRGAPVDGPAGNQRGLLAVFLSSSFKSSGLVLELQRDADGGVLYGQTDYEWFGSSALVLSSEKTLVVSAPTRNINFSSASSETPIAQGVGIIYAFDLTASSFEKFNQTSRPKWTLTGTKQFDRFGSAMATSNALISNSPTSKSLLVVSLGDHEEKDLDEPGDFWQSGAVVVLDTDGFEGNLLLAADGNNGTVMPLTRLHGIQMFARLGSALLTADINQDGLDDLLVSAPMQNVIVNGALVDQLGLVYYYKGGANFLHGEVKSPQQDATTIFQKAITSSGPDGSKQPKGFRFGHSMAAGRFLGPSQGQVLVFGSPRDPTQQPISGSVDIIVLH